MPAANVRRANQRIRPDDGNHSSSAVLSQPVSNFLVLFQPFSVLRCRAVERETPLEDANDVNDSDAVCHQQGNEDIEADCALSWTTAHLPHGRTKKTPPRGYVWLFFGSNTNYYYLLYLPVLPHATRGVQQGNPGIRNPASRKAEQRT